MADSESIQRRDALRRLIGGAVASTAAGSLSGQVSNKSFASGGVLEASIFEPYVNYFNQMVPEDVVNHVPNPEAFAWMQKNTPYFTCPDKNVEETYYYRWWSYRKHIKKTPKGFIVTEFLKPVAHATEFNAISCAFGLHLAEGRWLHDREYLDSYARFWLKSGENGGLQPKFHQFSGWASAALYERAKVTGDIQFLGSIIDALVLDYETWEGERQLLNGLFWQRDVSDGMEESISGGRKVRNIRPSINSYMYGNAVALAAVAKLLGHSVPATQYADKAEKLRRSIQQNLWNERAAFFETVLESGESSNVREAIGFTPWLFDLPEANTGYERAWSQLMDPKGFWAPYGPTTAEQRSPGFRVAYEGDDCQWNGPSWPFATSITLNALANVLNRYEQNVISVDDYFRTFLIYARSHVLSLPDGRKIPWVDENLNPFTGEWLARARKMERPNFYGRGDHYNHSSFADHVITGVVGLRPRMDDMLQVNPLIPEGHWNWFCLDHVLYRGHTITILWDQTGSKFGRGSGLRVFSNGNLVASNDRLTRITAQLA